MKIREKLLAIQSELKAPKNQVNGFGHYNYRSCEDILEALKPLLEKNKCTMSICDEIVNIGDRFYVKASVYLRDVETTEEVFTSAFAREELDKKGMDGSQITGASSSYARKYALNGLFLIDDTKDSDATNDGKTASPQPVQQTKPQETTVIGFKLQDKNLGLGTALCSICNCHMYFNEGTSKASKPYTNLKCEQNKDHIIWYPKPENAINWSELSDLPDKVVEDIIIPEDLPF